MTTEADEALARWQEYHRWAMRRARVRWLCWCVAAVALAAVLAYLGGINS